MVHRAGDTDGALLQDQTMHSVIRDMITRMDTLWPKYGVLPNQYGLPTSNGFQDSKTTIRSRLAPRLPVCVCQASIAIAAFCVSLAMALELGAFAYAKGVADNYLTHYVRSDGTLRYRGPELALDGRMLTLFG